MLKEMAQVAQVYLIAHVVDDVGEATVRWAHGLLWKPAVLLPRHLVGARSATRPGPEPCLVTRASGVQPLNLVQAWH